MKNYLKKVRNIFKRIYRKYESGRYRRKRYSNCYSIMSPEETVEYLKNNTVCFCRFGDGEISIMKGDSIAFQQYNAELAQRLKEIIAKNEPGLKIGINYLYFNPRDAVNPYTQKFLDAMAQQRKFMIKNCNKCAEYIDAGVTQLYQTYVEFDFEAHFGKMQHMFEGKDITLICGRTVMRNIEYNALNVCKSVNYIYAPEKDAFSRYPAVLEDALQVEADRIICVILGPAAKLLVYDLYKHGRIAWDIGHYLKDYDAYMKKQPRDSASIEMFFKPD